MQIRCNVKPLMCLWSMQIRCNVKPLMCLWSMQIWCNVKPFNECHSSPFTLLCNLSLCPFPLLSSLHMAFSHDGITLFPQILHLLQSKMQSMSWDGYLPLYIGQIPTLAVTTTASYRSSSYGLDWNWVWFSKLEPEFISFMNQTLNQIPGPIYAWNWNQDSFFFFFFFLWVKISTFLKIIYT
jgi:hypothetical protein